MTASMMEALAGNDTGRPGERNHFSLRSLLHAACPEGSDIRPRDGEGVPST